MLKIAGLSLIELQSILSYRGPKIEKPFSSVKISVFHLCIDFKEL